MLVFDNKTVSGHHTFDTSICLAGCTLEGAHFKVKGSVYIKRPTGKMVVSLEASEDIVFEDASEVEGSLSADSIVSQNPLSVDGLVVAKKIVLQGDSQFSIIRGEQLTAQGTVFADSIAMQSLVWVDGDLIANSLTAPTVKVERGQLLVRELSVESAEAEIIANYSFERLDTTRFRCKWVRPMVEGAEPRTLSPIDMTEGAFATLEAHTKHIAGFEQYYLTDRPPADCNSFGPYFDYLFMGLMKEYDKLFPAGKQFVECVRVHGFPSWLWRF